METKKLGIENLKKAVKVVVAFGNELQTATADGKFSPTEAFGFVDELAAVPGVINSRKEIVAEAKDLDSTEGQELRRYVREELQIANEKVEETIDSAIEWVLATVRVVSNAKALKA